jgi:hypothetical protein
MVPEHDAAGSLHLRTGRYWLLQLLLLTTYWLLWLPLLQMLLLSRCMLQMMQHAADAAAAVHLSVLTPQPRSSHGPFCLLCISVAFFHAAN